MAKATARSGEWTEKEATKKMMKKMPCEKRRCSDVFLWPNEIKYNHTRLRLQTQDADTKSQLVHVVIFSAVDTLCFLVKRKLKLKICLGDGCVAVEEKEQESKNKVLRLKMPAKLSREEIRNRKKAEKKTHNHTHTHIFNDSK